MVKIKRLTVPSVDEECEANAILIIADRSIKCTTHESYLAFLNTVNPKNYNVIFKHNIFTKDLLRSNVHLALFIISKILSACK